MWRVSAATKKRSTNPGLTLGPNVAWTHHARSTLATITCSRTAPRLPEARRLSWFSRGSISTTIPIPSASTRTTTRSPTASGFVSSISMASSRNLPRIRERTGSPSSVSTSYQLPVERTTSPRLTSAAGPPGGGLGAGLAGGRRQRVGGLIGERARGVGH